MKYVSQITLLLVCFVVVQGAPAQVVLQVLNPLGAHSAKIAGLGDVDGDGGADVAVSIPTLGTIGIFSGLNGSAITTWNMPNAQFDGYITSAGDSNGDSVPDVIVSEGSASLNYPFAQVCVHSGADGSEISLIPQFQPACGFGYRTAVVGDVNNDGFDDIAITAPTASTNSLSLNGSVRIHSGIDGALLLSVHGSSHNQYLGAGVTRMGDVDGDGTPDFAASSSAQGGSASIFSGSTGAVLETYSMGGNSLSGIVSLLQEQLQLAGGVDFNQDGVHDLVLGKPSHSQGGNQSGSVHVVSGSNGSLLQRFDGLPNSGLGDDLSLGDVNGDSVADLVVRELGTGRVVVFSGSAGIEVWDTTFVAANAEEAVLVGDTNLDGDRDLVLRLALSDPSNPGSLIVISGGPWLGESATSKVGEDFGSAEDILLVNGGNGGETRRVDIGVGESITFELGQPTTNVVPADFAIFGRVNPPQDTESYDLYDFGSICLIPKPLLVGAPDLFTLSSTLPQPGGEILPATLAPWVHIVHQGLAYPLTFTLQAVVAETPTSIRVSNAILIRVR